MNTKERTTTTRPGKITATHLTSLGSRLTDRDRQIALDCYDHRVLTTEQLMRLHFDGLRTTTLRLGKLYQLRVLDRFRPPRRQPGTGTNPYHWILDEAGAHVVAAQRDMERRRLRWQHSDAVDIAQSSKLRHHIEINEFFSLLSLEAQLKHGALREWYGERITSTLFKGVVPDGYGVIDLPTVRPSTCCSSSTAGPSQRTGCTRRPCSTPSRSRRAHSASATRSSSSLCPPPRAQSSHARPWPGRTHRPPSPNGAWPARTHRSRSSLTRQTRSPGGGWRKPWVARYEVIDTAPGVLPSQHADAPDYQTLEITARL